MAYPLIGSMPGVESINLMETTVELVNAAPQAVYGHRIEALPGNGKGLVHVRWMLLPN